MTHAQRLLALVALAVLEAVHLLVCLDMGLGPSAAIGRVVGQTFTVGIVLAVVEAVGRAQDAPERRP